jgi:hypothetical protein
VISDPDEYFELPDGEQTRMAMILGPGGVGKSYIYTMLYHYARWKGLEDGLNAAFSGIAATILPGGRTVHNLFGLPVPLYKDSSSSIEHNTKAARDTHLFQLHTYR